MVPRCKRKDIMRNAHDAPAAGHLGVHKTHERIRVHFFWPGCKEDVRAWIGSCPLCVAQRVTEEGQRAPMQSYISGAPFQRVSIDVTGPLKETPRGNKVILVLTDHFSKWAEAILYRTKKPQQ